MKITRRTACQHGAVSQLHQQPVDAVLHPTFIPKLCYKLQSVVTFIFIQTFDHNVVFFTEWRQSWRVCLMQRQNSRYFRCPVWKTKSRWESKPTWKLKHANSILESFEHLSQLSSKSILIISSYTVSNLVRFFGTPCSWCGSWCVMYSVWHCQH